MITLYPDTIAHHSSKKAVHILSHLILTKLLQRKYCYSYFTDKKIELRVLKDQTQDDMVRKWES